MLESMEEGDHEDKHRVKHTSLPLLPQDIVLYKILPSLTAKALWRLRLVSKTWNSKITCEEFVVSYLCRSGKKPKLLLGLSQSHYSLYHDDGKVEEITPKAWPWLVINQSSLVRCSRDGFLCLVKSIGDRCDLNIVNPITGKSWSVPSVSFLGSWIQFCQLVFDPRHKLYKLLISYQEHYSVSQFLVLTLRNSDESWRVIGPKNWCVRRYRPYAMEDFPCLDGNIYWLCVKGSMVTNYTSSFPEMEFIAAFDSKSEEFHVINCPPYYAEHEDERGQGYTKCLFAKGGCLYLLFFDGMRSSMDLWNLVDYENQIWSCCYSENTTAFPIVKGAWDLIALTTFAGEFLIEIHTCNGAKFLTSYDLKKRIFRMFLGDVVPTHGIVTYAESLISL